MSAKRLDRAQRAMARRLLQESEQAARIAREAQQMLQDYLCECADLPYETDLLFDPESGEISPKPPAVATPARSGGLVSAE